MKQTKSGEKIPLTQERIGKIKTRRARKVERLMKRHGGVMGIPIIELDQLNLGRVEVDRNDFNNGMEIALFSEYWKDYCGAEPEYMGGHY